MGARECAGLPLAVEPQRAKVDFPSKFLPPALHAKYASASDPGFSQANKAISAATDSVTTEALRRGRDSTADKHPEVVRHRQLRVAGANARSKITDVATAVKPVAPTSTIVTTQQPKIAFKDIAAEYFILPMMNRFWTYLQEEVTREQQTRGKYTVGGTGMILSPLSVSQFLSTLTIMVHAARHSTLYLSVICPESLELAISVGSKLSVAPNFTPSQGPSDAKDFESDVVATALELALVSIDGAQELDGGRAIATEQSLTLMAAGEWASEILHRETRGEATTTNTGGSREGRVQKAAAGLLVLVSGIVEKMQTLMN
jgi:telomere length regulation protein